MTDLFSASKTAAPPVTARQALGSSENKRQRDLQEAGRREAARRDDQHQCRICGVIGGFGFGGPLSHGKPMRWACFDHRDAVERMSE